MAGLAEAGCGDRDVPDLSSTGTGGVARGVSAGVFKAAGGYFVRGEWT